MSLSNMLYIVGEKLLNVSIKKALGGAGLGLASYEGLSKLMDKLISDSISSINSGDAVVLNMLGLAGVDTALSIIISACVVKIAFYSATVTVTKLT